MQAIVVNIIVSKKGTFELLCYYDNVLYVGGA